jgi:hypothetical protein
MKLHPGSTFLGHARRIFIKVIRHLASSLGSRRIYVIVSTVVIHLRILPPTLYLVKRRLVSLEVVFVSIWARTFHIIAVNVIFRPGTSSICHASCCGGCGCCDAAAECRIKALFIGALAAIAVSRISAAGFKDLF